MSLHWRLKQQWKRSRLTFPYLAAREGAIEKWRSKLNGAELKVGVAWAGNPNYPQDQDRSILLKNILPILEAKGADFSACKKIFVMATKNIGRYFPVVRLDQEINDFEDTAAIMSFLDL
jgi:hypothetical protein